LLRHLPSPGAQCRVDARSVAIAVYSSLPPECQAPLKKIAQVGAAADESSSVPAATMGHKVPRVVHMSLNIVVVMDPIGSIKIAKDSTFAMLLEGQRRGHTLEYVVPGGLGMIHGVAHARLAPLSVRDDPAAWFELGPASQRALGPGDVVLMRRDPPVDDAYIHDTQILSAAQRQGAQIVN